MTGEDRTIPSESLGEWRRNAREDRWEYGYPDGDDWVKLGAVTTEFIARHPRDWVQAQVTARFGVPLPFDVYTGPQRPDPEWHPFSPEELLEILNNPEGKR